MIVLFGAGTVGLLIFRKFRCNKQRQNGQYVFFPMVLIVIMFNTPGILFFAKAVKVLKDFTHLSVSYRRYT